MSPTEIRGIRRGLGLSQSQLASYLGIANARTVQRWESGDVLITGPAARCLQYMALHGLILGAGRNIEAAGKVAEKGGENG